MSNATLTSPLQHAPLTSNGLVWRIAAACVPGMALTSWWFGPGLLRNLLLCWLATLLLETLLQALRRPRRRGLSGSDHSGFLLATLFAIAVPAGAPWWLLLVGISFALTLARHAFGGLGQNPFNPAMCGYLLVLLCFPERLAELNFAPPPAAAGSLPAAVQQGLPLFPVDAGRAWELINMAYLLGGLYLVAVRLVPWQIPVGMFSTLGLLAALQGTAGSTGLEAIYLHYFGGATVLAAFFIATDPVSAAGGRLARLAYGCLIGATLYWLRDGTGPDPIAAAILLGNFCAPLLDHCLQPARSGHGLSLTDASSAGADHE